MTTLAYVPPPPGPRDSPQVQAWAEKYGWSGYPGYDPVTGFGGTPQVAGRSQPIPPGYTTEQFLGMIQPPGADFSRPAPPSPLAPQPSPFAPPLQDSTPRPAAPRPNPFQGLIDSYNQQVNAFNQQRAALQQAPQGPPTSPLGNAPQAPSPLQQRLGGAPQPSGQLPGFAPGRPQPKPFSGSFGGGFGSFGQPVKRQGGYGFGR